ncbi:hypothetical protein JHC27_02625 [archaeon]|nr:hypothetical protein [archaeon]
MRLNAIKIIIIAVVGVFIISFMPYLIGGTFMKPQTPGAKIMIGSVPVSLSSGMFYYDYFFSILGTSYLTYQFLATPLGYSGSTTGGAIASGMYSGVINPEWQYVALALAIILGLITTMMSRNLAESAIGILLGYVASSALQLYLVENLLASPSLGLNLNDQTMAFNAVLAFLISSNFVYLILSLLVSFAIIKYVFPPKAIPLQEKKVALASEVVTTEAPKKEEIAEMKPTEEVAPKEEAKTQASEVTPFEVATELKKEEKPPEAKLEVPEEPKEEVKIEKEAEIQAPEQKHEEAEIRPVAEEEKKAEEVIELPEEIFKSIEQPEIEEKEIEQAEAPTKEEVAPVEESTMPPQLKEEEKIKEEVVEEKVYEEKREPAVIISELEKPIIEFQEKKYPAKVETKLKVNLYCNVCGYKLVWNEEEGRYECPICGVTQ